MILALLILLYGVALMLGWIITHGTRGDDQ